MNGLITESAVPLDYVFLATLGQNDLQVAVRHGGSKPLRYALNKPCIRAFHQACLDKKFSVSVTPFSQTAEVREMKRISLDFSPERLQLECPLSEVHEADYIPPISCADGVELCAPLLAEAWRTIGTMSLGQAQRVVLFHTRRDEVDERGQPREKGEPIATVDIVRQRLMEAFGLERENQIEECQFLCEGDLYEVDVKRQRHLRATAARKIDARIRDLNSRFPNALAVVSDSGGFPEIKPVLAASVAYRFDDRYVFARPLDPGRSPKEQAKIIISPAESLSVRHQISRLIARGAFDAAAQLARHPMGDEVERSEPWRRSLACLSQYLRGGVVEEPPGYGMLGPLIKELQSGPRSLVVLLRIESALHRCDVETAVCDLITFVELSLLELAEIMLSKPAQLCVDWETARICLERSNTDPDAVPILRKESPNRVELDTKEQRIALAGRLPGPSHECWLEFFETTNHKPVMRARNCSTHARVTPEQLLSARLYLENHSIWVPYQGRLSLLHSVVARPLLDLLNAGDAGDRYDQITRAALHDMNDMSFQ
jgi:hypothetical protein